MYINNNLYFNGGMYNGYHHLNEAADFSSGNTKWILSLGEITFYNRKLKKEVTVDTKTVVKLIDDAMAKIQIKYPFLLPFIKHSKRMYVPYLGGIHSTMAVDMQKNLWINIPFVVVDLNSDVNRIFGIFFHELMHNFLNHIARSKEILPDEVRETLDSKTLSNEWRTMNICMDYEINSNMVLDKIVDKNFFEKIGAMDPMSTDKVDGEKITDLVKDKMWETLYRKHGAGLYKHYLSRGGVKPDEKFMEAMEEIKKCSRILGDPTKSEREKAEAREKLNKLLDELYGKKERARTIYTTLKKIQSTTKIVEVEGVGEALRDAIYEYTVDVIKMSKEEIEKAKKSAETFAEQLISNSSAIVDLFYSLDEDTFEKDVETMKKNLIEGTDKIHAERETITKDEYKSLIDDICDSIEDVFSDEIAKEKRREDKKRREEEKKKLADEAREKAKEKAEHRSYLDTLCKRFNNLFRYYDLGKISENTAKIFEKFYETTKSLLDVDINTIERKDVSNVLDNIENIKKYLKDDIHVLVDNKTIISKTKEEIDDIIDTACDAVDNCFKKLSDKEKNMTIIIGAISSAYEEMGIIGRLITAKKKLRPSDEFKKAYMDEMNRLMKIREELGVRGIQEELKKYV